jgi:hypothetical protein
MRLAKGFHFLLWVFFSISYVNIDAVHAAKFIGAGVLDKDYLIVHLSDGEVIHHEGGTGEQVIDYTPVVDTSAAVETGNWTITSSDDSNYDGAGQNPDNCHRKKKLSGHAELEWSGSDFTYDYTYDHWIYLELPSALQQGATYTLTIDPAVNSDTSSASITFDIYSSRSEAIHVNLVGYAPEAPHKAADLYYWMGDGGARDYSTFQGNNVYVYNIDTQPRCILITRTGIRLPAATNGTAPLPGQAMSKAAALPTAMPGADTPMRRIGTAT